MSTSDSFSNRKNIIWVYLSGAMALTFVVLLFLPDSGTGGATLSLYSTMLWCGLFGAALFGWLEWQGYLDRLLPARPPGPPFVVDIG